MLSVQLEEYSKERSGINGAAQAATLLLLL